MSEKVRSRKNNTKVKTTIQSTGEYGFGASVTSSESRIVAKGSNGGGCCCCCCCGGAADVEKK